MELLLPHRERASVRACVRDEHTSDSKAKSLTSFSFSLNSKRWVYSVCVSLFQSVCENWKRNFWTWSYLFDTTTGVFSHGHFCFYFFIFLFFQIPQPNRVPSRQLALSFLWARPSGPPIIYFKYLLIFICFFILIKYTNIQYKIYRLTHTYILII